MFLPSRAKKRNRISFFGELLAVLVIGIASSAYVYFHVDESGRLHILDRAATIAAAIPLDDIRALEGADDDLASPSYARIKSLLTGVRDVNHDARFIYIIGRGIAGDLFFYADSEDPTSPDYSPPGQVYDEATPAMRALFGDGLSRTEGPDRDRWGLWISGYAPVLDENGAVVALLGIDLPADAYLSDIIIYSALPLLLAIFLIILLIVNQRTRERELRYLEQKEEFLSIASHEIRTPLTGIRWAIETLLHDRAERTQADTDLLALVHGNVLTIISRITNLLDVAALEHGARDPLKKERIPLRAFFAEIIDSLALTARGRDIRLVLDPSVTEAATLFGDRQMMYQVFFNLIGNAIKYTEPDTNVTVSYEPLRDLHVIRVRDQGKGIPPEEQENIFAGYHRTDDAARSKALGTGLGLYLVKKVIELHGGSVKVESSPRGTAFAVSLPR